MKWVKNEASINLIRLHAHLENTLITLQRVDSSDSPKFHLLAVAHREGK